MNQLEKHITLKGTNDGYYLLINEESSYQEIFEDLDELFEHLKKGDHKDQSFELTIDSGNRLLSDEMQKKLTDKIFEQTDFTVKAFKQHVIEKTLAEDWHKDTSPLILVKNIRNGQIIRSDRDIILIGDVRPGALIRSAGSIIVIGNVNGTIHAGANGDESAVIVAPFMHNGQVRISEHVEIIDMDDDESKIKSSEMPQIVYLNDLHVLEFAEINQLAQIRPDFGKDLGGFEEWQKQL